MRARCSSAAGVCFGLRPRFSTFFLRTRAREWAKARREEDGTSSWNGSMTSLRASSMAAKPGDTSSVRSAAHARLRAALAFVAALPSQFSERVSAGSTAARAAGSQSSNRTSHSRTGPVAAASSRRRGFQTATNATGNTGAKVTHADRRRRNDTRYWWRSSSVGAGAASLASASRSASICSSTIPAKTERILEGERLLTPLPKK